MLHLLRGEMACPGNGKQARTCAVGGTQGPRTRTPYPVRPGNNWHKPILFTKVHKRGVAGDCSSSQPASWAALMGQAPGLLATGHCPPLPRRKFLRNRSSRPSLTSFVGMNRVLARDVEARWPSRWLLASLPGMVVFAAMALKMLNCGLEFSHALTVRACSGPCA